AAAASAIAVAGVVAAPSSAAKPRTGVSFSSSPVSAAIVAHYTVTPASRSHAAHRSSVHGGSQDQLPDLSPKAYLTRRASIRTRTRSSAAPALRDSAGRTPAKTASFIGQQGSNITCSYFAQGCNPPDMAVAASPSFVLQGVNTQWEVLNPNGKVLAGWPVSAQRFFNVPDELNPNGSSCDAASGNQPFLSDPRAVYDPASHRFWAAMLQVEGGLGIATHCPFKTVYFVAVSRTSDPRGSWNVYEFEMSHGTPFAADFTQIGLNSDAVFFSANMFGLSGGFYSEIFEANKAQMEHGRANFTADGFANLQGNGPGIPIAGVGPFLADTVQPVLALGGGGSDRAPAPGSHDGLFVDTIDGPDLVSGNLCSSQADACKGMILWRMTHPISHDSGGSAPTLTGTYLPDTKPFSFPPPADQPSCNRCVDANDLRIPATPMLRGSTIYTGWGTGLDNGTQVVPAAEWAEVGVTGAHASTTTGYFTLPGDDAAAYPAFMPDGAGNVVMVYEHMGNSTFPEAKYVQHRSGSPFTGTGRVLRAGQASYRPTLCGTSAIPVCRWGDYEAMSFDGNGRIWMAGQYANTHTDPAIAPWFGRNWGTWIGALGPNSQGG
ncbi:MAG: hypothetical protein ACRDVG_17275, partial [Jatrophihabitantaceae bacterium]